MHTIIDVANALKIEMPTLTSAYSRTEEFVKSARATLQVAVPRSESLDVLALGSIGRYEMSAQSDFDWLIVAHGLPHDIKSTETLFAAIDQLSGKAYLRKPGATGMFGTVISAMELTEKIGLDQDTNLSHSRRILILEESVSICQPESHERLVRAMLDRYLADYHDKPKQGVPRFLLNDVLRYWRTLVVDYQAKRWHGSASNWGLRYLKLILSRKLAFAGTLASLLLCEETSVDYFQAEFTTPPLVRLARIHEHLDKDEDETRDHLKRVFRIGEDFAAALAEDAFRAEVNDIAQRSDAQEGSEFSKWLGQARELQDALEHVFFDAQCLRDKSKRYLSF